MPNTEVKTVGCPAFLNNLHCQEMIEDKIEILARELLAEVIHKVKYSINFEEMVNVMVEQGRFSADISSAKDEMLFALEIQYGLKDSTDPDFAAARQACLQVRNEEPKQKFDAQQAFIEHLLKMQKQADELALAVKGLTEHLLQLRRATKH